VQKSALRWAVIVVSVLLAAAACRRNSDKGVPVETTQTVAPAAAQPAPTGTDAMTETVNVDSGRSEGEAAVGGSDTSATIAKPAVHAAKPTTAKKHK
jgi:cytoskeletal protein RodZ